MRLRDARVKRSAREKREQEHRAAEKCFALLMDVANDGSGSDANLAARSALERIAAHAQHPERLSIPVWIECRVLRCVDAGDLIEIPANPTDEAAFVEVALTELARWRRL